MIKCTFCGKEMQNTDRICPHCSRMNPTIWPDPTQMRVYAADGREYGSHLPEDKQGIYNEAFAKAFANGRNPQKFCASCGAKLREDAAFCSMCGASCAATSNRGATVAQTVQTKEKGSGKKLLILIAVLAAALLLVAGILFGILLGGNGSSQRDRDDDDDEEVRDRDDRDEEGEDSENLFGRTDVFKLVSGTRYFQEGYLENTTSFGYNEEGQLISYELCMNSLQYGDEQAILLEYTYDEAGNVIAADMTVGDMTVTFTYDYEDGSVVSCSGEADGSTLTFLYSTIDGGKILDISMYLDGEEQVTFVSAAYDDHGCLERVGFSTDSGSKSTVYNCDGKEICSELFGSWYTSRTETDYDEAGRMTAVRQYMNEELVTETLYRYNDSKRPALESMTVISENAGLGDGIEMVFSWRGNVGVWEGDPSVTGGENTTRTVTVDEDGDILSLVDVSEEYRAESETSYVELALPAGQTPSDPNDLIYLHNLFVMAMR